MCVVSTVLWKSGRLQSRPSGERRADSLVASFQGSSRMEAGYGTRPTSTAELSVPYGRLLRHIFISLCFLKVCGFCGNARFSYPDLVTYT